VAARPRRRPLPTILVAMRTGPHSAPARAAGAIAVLACLLLLIQGVSETIKSVWAARTGIELEHKEKIEI